MPIANVISKKHNNEVIQFVTFLFLFGGQATTFEFGSCELTIPKRARSQNYQETFFFVI